ncbi:DUF2243 domain-containing protein [Streptomyces sp. NPDC006134]|uniref:DUF2243 domain-containing protein n=1 Tax=Streptomyces sp. NPDC006134 TaxID=3154467 RepID=UPI0033FC981C
MTYRRSVAGGALLGIGLAAFVDEAVFHQLLHWHHFYDRSTPGAGLVSDGLLHAGSWLATVAGLFVYADLRRRGGPRRPAWWAGVCLGAGGFQLFDGVVDHKLLRVHQIRYGVDVTPYDWAWNAVAVLLLLTGLLLWRRARRSALPRGTGRHPLPRP